MSPPADDAGFDGPPDQAGERFRVERAADLVFSPIKEFIHNQTVSASVLLLATIAGLVFANSALSSLYAEIGHMPIAISVADWRLEMTLHHWVNDGLMVLFFFMLGLEIKRELLAGELQDPRTAIAVTASALGGMVLPALLYAAFNAGAEGGGGWAIPMATDAAFALGALAVLGARAPVGLSAFLVGLAIIDDIGAVMVVAIFYTESLSLPSLAAAGACVVVLLALNVLGVRRIWPYLIIGIGLWWAVLSSGVHATIAGVLLALCIPARARMSTDEFVARAREVIDEHERGLDGEDGALGDDQRHTLAQQLREGTRQVTAPLQRWENNVEIPVAYLVIPLFAFLNAGIALDKVPPSSWFSDPVSLGVILGLVLGKVLGIFGCAWLACTLGPGRLPEGVSLGHITGAGLLAGMGFTMSLFIAALAFEGEATLLAQAKTGILLASAAAGVLGIAWLWFMPAAEKGADSNARS